MTLHRPQYTSKSQNSAYHSRKRNGIMSTGKILLCKELGQYLSFARTRLRKIISSQHHGPQPRRCQCAHPSTLRFSNARYAFQFEKCCDAIVENLPPRRQRARFIGWVTEQVGVSDQAQVSRGSQPNNSPKLPVTETACHCRRGDRIRMLFAAVRWSRLAQSGHSRHRNNLVAVGPKRTKSSFRAGAVCPLMTNSGQSNVTRQLIAGLLKRKTPGHCPGLSRSSVSDVLSDIGPKRKLRPNFTVWICCFTFSTSLLKSRVGEASNPGCRNRRIGIRAWPTNCWRKPIRDHRRRSNRCGSRKWPRCRGRS